MIFFDGSDYLTDGAETSFLIAQSPNDKVNKAGSAQPPYMSENDERSWQIEQSREVREVATQPQPSSRLFSPKH